jgi:hypothetical protein
VVRCSGRWVGWTILNRSIGVGIIAPRIDTVCQRGMKGIAASRKASGVPKAQRPCHSLAPRHLPQVIYDTRLSLGRIDLAPEEETVSLAICDGM